MHKFNKLLEKVSDAKEVLERAERERDGFLEPILIALGATGGGIESVYLDGDTVHVSRCGSTRGCPWQDDYQFPMDIFTASDPVAAATKYAADQKALKANEDRATKLRQLDNLKRELGV